MDLPVTKSWLTGHYLPIRGSRPAHIDRFLGIWREDMETPQGLERDEYEYQSLMSPRPTEKDLKLIREPSIVLFDSIRVARELSFDPIPSTPCLTEEFGDDWESRIELERIRHYKQLDKSYIDSFLRQEALNQVAQYASTSVEKHWVAKRIVTMIRLRLGFMGEANPLFQSPSISIQEPFQKPWRESVCSPSWDPNFVIEDVKIERSMTCWENGVIQIFVSPNAVICNPKILCFWEIINADHKDDEGRINLSGGLPDRTAYWDLHRCIRELSESAAIKQFCYRRLQELHAGFKRHCQHNGRQEERVIASVPHRDIYSVRKVDNHIHHSAAMSQIQLLKTIKRVCERDKQRVVFKAGSAGLDKDTTLEEVLQQNQMTTWTANCDNLDVQALGDCFHRFDKFNGKYSPFGDSKMRQLFLKVENDLQGEYLAELSHEMFDTYAEQRYQYAEMRLTVMGSSSDDLFKVADWVTRNGLYHRKNRWVLQIPRLYSVHRARGAVSSFGEVLENLFQPMVEAILDPQNHQEVYRFLLLCSGIDSVDDESKTEPVKTWVSPNEWTGPEEPSYAYWMYHVAINLRAINRLLAFRGRNSLKFRPHAGETGATHHLVSAFLTADMINHGLKLRGQPTLQYLFYILQIPISMSPMSNNALFKEISDNPLPEFHAKGLHVAISTDDPLIFHFTPNALMEEISSIRSLFRFSMVDLCEMILNSVYHSCFEQSFKDRWTGLANLKPETTGFVGQAVHWGYHIPWLHSERAQYTNVPGIRSSYRLKTYRNELRFLATASGDADFLPLGIVEHRLAGEVPRK